MGGLIGLGGGEFRLPVLVKLLGFGARRAVPLNLTISLITLAASLAVRSRTLTLDGARPFGFAMLGLALGGVIGASFSSRLVARLTDHRLERAAGGLLAAIGLLLLMEGLLPLPPAGLVADERAAHAIWGLVLGSGIGAVSTLLGVAGGELLIPTLLFVFGADIRTAGTISVMISCVIVSAGLYRYWRLGMLPDTTTLGRVGVPMGLGSIFGAFLGGALAGVASTGALKLLLGTLLIMTAWKAFAGHGRGRVMKESA